MCYALYLATDKPLPISQWNPDAPGVCVVHWDERKDNAVRRHFSKPNVQYVASTSGCGCDFPFAMLVNEWFQPADPNEKPNIRKSRHGLVDLLRKSGEPVVEAYGVWEGDQHKQPRCRELIDLDKILNPEFFFKEQGFYEIRLSPRP